MFFLVFTVGGGAASIYTVFRSDGSRPEINSHILEKDTKSTQNEVDQPKKIAVPAYLSSDDVKRMLVERNFYDKDRNPNGTGIKHRYEPDVGLEDAAKVIIDRATNLTWQQSVSVREMNYIEAEAYIENLRLYEFAGIGVEWRLPTLEEAMSLMEPPTNQDNPQYIDSVFDQKPIWTADKESAADVWGVDFEQGYYVRLHYAFSGAYVRAVCTLE